MTNSFDKKMGAFITDNTINLDGSQSKKNI